MIPFFRKIRYDLMEKNKTGKYLKYAIGEIVLVVIGILIALSINNWNEDRKLDDSIQTYYQQLLADLQTDKNDSKSMISILESNTSLYNNYQEIYKEPNLTISKVSEGLSNNSYNNVIIKFKTSTIKTLISTGSINFIKPILRDKLTTYNGIRAQIISASQTNAEGALNLLQSAMMDGAIEGFLIRIQNQPELMNVLDIENKYPEIILKLEAYLRWRHINESSTVGALNNLIKDADTIIELINKELEK